MPIDKSAIGTIQIGSNLGTAFVLNSKRLVISCDHTFPESDKAIEIYFHNSDRDRTKILNRKLTLIKRLTGFDIAAFESEEDLCDIPLKNLNDFNLHLGQAIQYIGYGQLPLDEVFKIFPLNNAPITEKDKKEKAPGILVDYIKFIASIICGWSGGPIMDAENNVVAIINNKNKENGIKMATGYSLMPILPFLPII